jgi:hypothetical protein
MLTVLRIRFSAATATREARFTVKNLRTQRQTTVPLGLVAARDDSFEGAARIAAARFGLAASSMGARVELGGAGPDLRYYVATRTFPEA